MNIVWEAMAAMSAVLIICGTLIALFVRLSIESALMRFKNELVECLDERYVLRVEHDAIHTQDRLRQK